MPAASALYNPGMRFWQLESCAVETHHPQVLHSAQGAHRVILLALPAGELLQEHQVHEHALVFLTEGRLQIESDGTRQELSAPGLAHFQPAERHEVRALSDCRLVLCLTPWPGAGHPGVRAALDQDGAP